MILFKNYCQWLTTETFQISWLHYSQCHGNWYIPSIWREKTSMNMQCTFVEEFQVRIGKKKYVLVPLSKIKKKITEIFISRKLACILFIKCSLPTHCVYDRDLILLYNNWLLKDMLSMYMYLECRKNERSVTTTYKCEVSDMMWPSPWSNDLISGSTHTFRVMYNLCARYGSLIFFFVSLQING